MDSHLPTTKRRDHAYVVWGGVCLGLSIIGFWPTYIAPVALGTYHTPSPSMPWHVVSVVLWLALLIVQPVLILKRRVQAHYVLGAIGAVVALSVVLSGAVVQFDVIPAHARAGRADDAGPIPFIRLTLLLGFAVCVVLALAFRRRPEWHKRLMLLGTFPLMQSPFDRMGTHLFGVPDVSGVVAIAGHFGLMLVFLAWDRWRLGYFHPVSKWSTASLFGFYFLSPIFAQSDWWRKAVERISHA